MHALIWRILIEQEAVHVDSQYNGIAFEESDGNNVANAGEYTRYEILVRNTGTYSCLRRNHFDSSCMTLFSATFGNKLRFRCLSWMLLTVRAPIDMNRRQHPMLQYCYKAGCAYISYDTVQSYCFHRPTLRCGRTYRGGETCGYEQE